jgi:hypothetical protein
VMVILRGAIAKLVERQRTPRILESRMVILPTCIEVLLHLGH